MAIRLNNAIHCNLANQNNTGSKRSYVNQQSNEKTDELCMRPLQLKHCVNHCTRRFFVYDFMLFFFLSRRFHMNEMHIQKDIGFFQTSAWQSRETHRQKEKKQRNRLSHKHMCALHSFKHIDNTMQTKSSIE